MSRTYTYAHLETKMAKKRNPFGQQVKSFYGEVSIPTLGVEMTGNDGISSTIMPLRPKMQVWKSSGPNCSNAG